MMLTCEYPTIAGVLKLVVIKAVGPPKNEAILSGIMPNDPNVFQTTRKASISGLISLVL